MNNDSTISTSSPRTLKQRIMRRIYFIYMVRNCAPFAFDCVVIVLAAFFVTVFVSVRDVLANFSVAASGSNAFHFSVAAISGTKLQTKLLLLFLGIVGFFAVRHLKRAVRAVQVLSKTKKVERWCPNEEKKGATRFTV